MIMKVPFIDFERQYSGIQDKLDKSILDALHSKKYILGPEVEKFERRFAEYCGAKFAIGVSSGTAALFLALKSLGIRKDDEVIIPANTYIAAALAVSYTGARPVLVEMNDETYNIDTNKIESAISNRTKAILPVHLYGQPADVDKILEIANKYNLRVIWDACQAHGSMYNEKIIGGERDIVCFSFYPTKNLGCFGDGGIITTSNEEIAIKLRKLRDYGRTDRYANELIGYNSRLDELQAACLNVSLNYLDGWNEKRIKNAETYGILLSDIKEIKPPKKIDAAKHIYHLYIIRAKKRDELIKYLAEKEIQTLIHYPIPIYLQKAYSGNGYEQVDLGYKKGDFPATEKFVEETVSLPMFPDMTHEEIVYVVNTIKEFYIKK